MTRILFTSDPHLTDRTPARTRGFLTPDGEADTDAHDAWYQGMWRSHVTKRDIVYVCGDVTGGGAERRRRAFEILRGLPGRKIAVLGNHDDAHPASMSSVRPGVQREWLEVFDAVMPFAVRRIMVDGVRRKVLLSHFPYFGDGDHSTTERFAEYRLKNTGLWLLHGHTHKAYQRVHDGHQIHVGIDAWGRPVTETEVAEMIAATESGREHTVPFSPLGDPSRHVPPASRTVKGHA